MTDLTQFWSLEPVTYSALCYSNSYWKCSVNFQEWMRQRLLSDWMCCSSTMVPFHPKTGLTFPVLGLDEVVVMPRMAALRGHMVATVENLLVRAALYEAVAWLVLCTEKSWRKLIIHSCPWLCWRRNIRFRGAGGIAISNCHNTVLSTFFIWFPAAYSINFDAFPVRISSGSSLNILQVQQGLGVVDHVPEDCLIAVSSYATCSAADIDIDVISKEPPQRLVFFKGRCIIMQSPITFGRNLTAITSLILNHGYYRWPSQ